MDLFAGQLGRFLIVLGVVLVLVGVVVSLGGPKLSFLGKLPGDIHVVKKGFSFHFPVVTCILLSVLLTVLLNLIFRR